MDIKRGSFLFKLRYGPDWTLKTKNSLDTNLCAFFWKSVFMLFIGWPVVIVFAIVVCTAVGILFICRNIFSILFLCQVVKIDKDSFKVFCQVDVPRWPRLLGWRVRPGIIIVAMLLWWFSIHQLIAGILSRIASDLLASWPILQSAFGTPVGKVIAVTIIGMIVAATLIKLGVGSLIGARLKAWKDGVCPQLRYTGFPVGVGDSGPE